ncbi:MAG: hypothetical protein ABEH47_07595 [Haloferacaceae archaeon]
MSDDAANDGSDGSRAPDGGDEFEAELARARDLLASDDLTAFHVGVVRDGEEVETTFSYRTDGVDVDPDREGIQALTLLATHLRVVADEAGVDRETAAADAAALADRVEETAESE